jgi:hypothetical protein
MSRPDSRNLHTTSSSPRNMAIGGRLKIKNILRRLGKCHPSVPWHIVTDAPKFQNCPNSHIQRRPKLHWKIHTNKHQCKRKHRTRPSEHSIFVACNQRDTLLLQSQCRRTIGNCLKLFSLVAICFRMITGSETRR